MTHFRITGEFAKEMVFKTDNQLVVINFLRIVVVIGAGLRDLL